MVCSHHNEKTGLPHILVPCLSWCLGTLCLIFTSETISNFPTAIPPRETIFTVTLFPQHTLLEEHGEICGQIDASLLYINKIMNSPKFQIIT